MFIVNGVCDEEDVMFC